MDDSQDDFKTPEIGKGKAGPGRPPGMANKVTRTLKEAVLKAAEISGKKIDPDASDGTVAYLVDIAENHKNLFMPVLGKIVPMAVVGPENPDGSDGPVVIKIYAGPKKEE